MWRVSISETRNPLETEKRSPGRSAGNVTSFWKITRTAGRGFCDAAMPTRLSLKHLHNTAVLPPLEAVPHCPQQALLCIARLHTISPLHHTPSRKHSCFAVTYTLVFTETATSFSRHFLRPVILHPVTRPKLPSAERLFPTCSLSFVEKFVLYV